MRSWLIIVVAFSALALVHAEYQRQGYGGPTYTRGARQVPNLPSLPGLGGAGGAGIPEYAASRQFPQRRFYNPNKNQMTVQNRYGADGPENFNHLLGLNLKYLQRLGGP